MVKVEVARWLSPSEYYYVNDEGDRMESDNDSAGLKIQSRLLTTSGFCLEMKLALVLV